MLRAKSKKKNAGQRNSQQVLPAPTRPAAFRVALIGNPNAGKTTIFNALCGARQHTGNYAGVTVEKKTGSIKGHDGIEVIDLPGTYSLKPKSADEEITSRVLHGEAGGEQKPDLAVVVLDAGNLKRSLYLCLQVQETGVPVIGVLTMSDIAKRRGYTVDVAALEGRWAFASSK
jgi:ferrous iron transport protein B